MKLNKSQMKRVFELHQLIQQNKYPNCASFSVKWEVSSKTIQRDVDFLKDEMGAPIEYDALKRGYYYTDPCFMLPAVSMTEGDLLALAIGSRALAAYRGTPMAEKLATVLYKLEDMLPNEITINPAEIFTQFSFSAPPSIPVKPKVWEVVIESLLTKRQMEITYNNKKSRVHPLHMANLQGQWYLFVRFYDYPNFKQLSMGRLQEATLRKESVDDNGFNAEELLKNTLGRFAGDNESFTVRLQFSSEVTESVAEREWHMNQRIQTNDDGSIELEFDAKGDIEVKRWIMAWGRYCKVIEPQWIREMIDEEVDAMLANRAS